MACGREGGSACRKQIWKGTEANTCWRGVGSYVGGEMSGTIRGRVTEKRGDLRHGYRGTHPTVPYTPVSSGN